MHWKSYLSASKNISIHKIFFPAVELCRRSVSYVCWLEKVNEIKSGLLLALLMSLVVPSN